MLKLEVARKACWREPGGQARSKPEAGQGPSGSRQKQAKEATGFKIFLKDLEGS